MGNRADEIAREIFRDFEIWVAEDGKGNLAVDNIASALRAYGVTCRDEGLEEVARECDLKLKRSGSGVDMDMYVEMAEFVRTLKSKPESKEPPAHLNQTEGR